MSKGIYVHQNTAKERTEARYIRWIMAGLLTTACLICFFRNEQVNVVVVTLGTVVTTLFGVHSYSSYNGDVDNQPGTPD